MRHIRLGLKFLVSGGVATGINIGVLYLLTEYVGWYYLVSAITAFIIAFCFSFSLQKFWTFKDGRVDVLHTQMPLYLLVSLVALFCNTSLLFVLVQWLHVWYIAAAIIVAGLVALGTFFAYRTFIFSRDPNKLVPASTASVKKYAALLYIFLAFFIAAFFATYKLSDSPALWYDEGLYSSVSAHISLYGLQALQIAPGKFVATDTMTVGYPLLYPVAAAYHFFGIGALQGRAVMAVFIILFVVASFLFIRKLFGNVSALSVLLLLATFPMLYGNGKSVLGEVPGLLFLILSLLSLWHLEQNKYKGAWRYILFGLTAGLCVATKPIFIVVLGAFFITYLIKIKKIQPSVSGVVLGGLIFTGIVALWAYLQFGVHISLQSVVSFYANPYGSENINTLIIQNVIRFFTESTPIYTLALMLVWAVALYIRRKKELLSAAEISAFIFCILVLLAYLRLPGWYRYLFPALTVALIFLPPSLSTLFSYTKSKVRFISHPKATFIPYAVIALLAGMQLYQTAANSYVAQYYSSKVTERLVSALAPHTNSSFFLYNVPQVAILLPTQRYYQYLPITERLVLGKEGLSALVGGEVDFVVVGSETYARERDAFSRYRMYKTIDRYEILERIPKNE